ncbi:cysteine desulfurase family protein [Thalassospiraceae bacterium LMO-JJ14]|nr:cysteine desulfurase family protein [Thalassospiraceae bacterium LMO-JJ14]
MTACYLDHNATTPLGHAARDAMARAMGVAGELTGNASSVHGFGREARRIIEDARASVGELAGVAPQNVIFTSGGSEANNTILRGIPAAFVATSAIEHASVLDAAPDARRVPVDASGVLRLDALSEMLEGAEGRVLVSVMAANNETGVVQPIAEIAAITKAHDALLHVDAIQWAAKRPLFEITAYCDALSLSAHKFGGPQGVGAIVVKDGVAFEPLIRGGGQERRRRAGTENLIGISGFGAACAAALDSVAGFSKLAGLRDGIESALGGDARVYGAGAERLANTTCIAMPGVSAETQVMAFDLAGIAVSAGSACSSGKVEPSHVLLAMGATKTEAAEAVRVSLGLSNTADDVQKFINAWRSLRTRAASKEAAA